jgi:hypothetical protein
MSIEAVGKSRVVERAHLKGSLASPTSTSRKVPETAHFQLSLFKIMFLNSYVYLFHPSKYS